MATTRQIENIRHAFEMLERSIQRQINQRDGKLVETFKEYLEEVQADKAATLSELKAQK